MGAGIHAFIHVNNSDDLTYIEDIALHYQEIIDVTLDDEERKKVLLYLQSNFNTNETIDCAFKALQNIK